MNTSSNYSMPTTSQGLADLVIAANRHIDNYNALEIFSLGAVALGLVGLVGTVALAILSSPAMALLAAGASIAIPLALLYVKAKQLQEKEHICSIFKAAHCPNVNFKKVYNNITFEEDLIHIKNGVDSSYYLIIYSNENGYKTKKVVMQEAQLIK